jgi:hypothetical protein
VEGGAVFVSITERRNTKCDSGICEHSRKRERLSQGVEGAVYVNMADGGSQYKEFCRSSMYVSIAEGEV